MLTVAYNVSILVFSDLEERRPLCIVLQIESQFVGLGILVQIALGELVEVVRPESTEVRHCEELVNKEIRGDACVWRFRRVLSKSNVRSLEKVSRQGKVPWVSTS